MDSNPQYTPHRATHRWTLSALRREISVMDDKLTPFNARSMPEQIEQVMFPVRVALWTYGCIGVFGLILASVGLAGVTAYSVTQRGREIGIRIALGARSTEVLGLVVKEGAVLVAVGTLIGLAGAGTAGWGPLSAEAIFRGAQGVRRYGSAQFPRAELRGRCCGRCEELVATRTLKWTLPK